MEAAPWAARRESFFLLIVIKIIILLMIAGVMIMSMSTIKYTVVTVPDAFALARHTRDSHF